MTGGAALLVMAIAGWMTSTVAMSDAVTACCGKRAPSNDGTPVAVTVFLTNADSFPGDNQAIYEITALPLSLSLYYAAMTNPKWRVNVFGGVGSLLAATSSIRFNFGTVTVAVSDQKNGLYGHAGVEGEYLVHPRVAAYGRVLGRVASATDLYSDSELEAYGTAQIKGREVNFSGFGAHVGVRAYIGY